MADNFDIKDFTLAAACTVRATDNAGVKTPWHILEGGDVAHDAADAHNPIKLGARAKALFSTLTLVSADDRTNLFSDLDGALLTREDSPLGDVVSAQATDTTGNSTACIAAQGSGIKTYLTDVTIANSSVSFVTVDIKDGTTIKWTFPVPASSGVTHRFRTPLAGTANTAWNFDASAATTTISCSMSGFKSKV